MKITNIQKVWKTIK